MKNLVDGRGHNPAIAIVRVPGPRRETSGPPSALDTHSPLQRGSVGATILVPAHLQDPGRALDPKTVTLADETRGAVLTHDRSLRHAQDRVPETGVAAVETAQRVAALNQGLGQGTAAPEGIQGLVLTLDRMIETAVHGLARPVTIDEIGGHTLVLVLHPIQGVEGRGPIHLFKDVGRLSKLKRGVL